MVPLLMMNARWQSFVDPKETSVWWSMSQSVWYGSAHAKSVRRTHRFSHKRQRLLRWYGGRCGGGTVPYYYQWKLMKLSELYSAKTIITLTVVLMVFTITLIFWIRPR